MWRHRVYMSCFPKKVFFASSQSSISWIHLLPWSGYVTFFWAATLSSSLSDVTSRVGKTEKTSPSIIHKGFTVFENHSKMSHIWLFNMFVYIFIIARRDCIAVLSKICGSDFSPKKLSQALQTKFSRGLSLKRVSDLLIHIWIFTRLFQRFSQNCEECFGREVALDNFCHLTQYLLLHGSIMVKNFVVDYYGFGLCYTHACYYCSFGHSVRSQGCEFYLGILLKNSVVSSPRYSRERSATKYYETRIRFSISKYFVKYVRKEGMKSLCSLDASRLERTFVENEIILCMMCGPVLWQLLLLLLLPPTHSRHHTLLAPAPLSSNLLLQLGLLQNLQ